MNFQFTPEFTSGFITGFILAAFFGMVLTNIREARGRMRLRHNPLDSFPDRAQPNLTANRIVWTSRFATLGCAFWVVILIISIVILAYMTMSSNLGGGA